MISPFNKDILEARLVDRVVGPVPDFDSRHTHILGWRDGGLAVTRRIRTLKVWCPPSANPDTAWAAVGRPALPNQLPPAIRLFPFTGSPRLLEKLHPCTARETSNSPLTSSGCPGRETSCHLCSGVFLRYRGVSAVPLLTNSGADHEASAGTSSARQGEYEPSGRILPPLARRGGLLTVWKSRGDEPLGPRFWSIPTFSRIALPRTAEASPCCMTCMHTYRPD